MNREIEKIEAMEQVLESLTPKIITIEQSIPKLLSQGEVIEKVLIKMQLLEKSNRQEKLSQSVSELNDKLSTFPKVIPVKNHHHFEHKSKAFLIGLAISVFVIACSIGITISVLLENSRMRQSAEKLKIISAYYPKVVKMVDSALTSNPDLVNQADKILLEQEELEQAMLEKMMSQAQYEDSRKKVIEMKKVKRKKL